MNSLRALFIYLFLLKGAFFFSVLHYTVPYVLGSGRMFVLLMNIEN